jgi:hypothetical protein
MAWRDAYRFFEAMAKRWRLRLQLRLQPPPGQTRGNQAKLAPVSKSDSVMECASLSALWRFSGIS